jgi:hypothetical protein
MRLWPSEGSRARIGEAVAVWMSPTAASVLLLLYGEAWIAGTGYPWWVRAILSAMVWVVVGLNAFSIYKYGQSRRFHGRLEVLEYFEDRRRTHEQSEHEE